MARPPKPELPLREGVAASAVFCPPGPWATTTAFLAERLPRVDDWPERVACGDVVDDEGRPVADVPYRGNRRVYYWRHLDVEPDIPFRERIVFQDEHLLVADKPHFLPVTPSGLYARQTLMARLRHATGLVDLNPVHRLDRETAGLVVFNLRRDERNAYHQLFRERVVDKVYEAIAPLGAGPWPRVVRHRLEEPRGEGFMQMQVVAGEPNAETWIDLVEALPGGLARYELRPKTGLRHQLRAQMNALGLPLVGDRIYPVLQPHENPPRLDAPLQLVARAISFTDPVTGLQRSFERAALTIAPR
ncbi:tRNA pseudouridine32 synthase/23S rRNA pseudouridine746 synthase [Pelomonas saccharophila]|uniref:tRNA pseudouridine32 synthase/23S rRNA pseudouridine746 synthase n=1 Tax=Roseateles saccharophilus TaxID=304 RepID=A0ABU1YVQ8_ROSSA|nr:pseudouridine synthase [Roseateles saccharophilus]MDR7272932.1 tRNA pseudouridine32 synthase/23S rRNA pseudouridine746 synthase [Roseateles saccharophilus]